MANGDITTIKVAGSYSIPGGGKNLTGGAENNKIIVWGTLEGTYDQTVGLDLNTRGGLRALGVSTCDFFSFEIRQAGVSGTRTNPTQQKLFKAGRENENGGGNVGSVFCFDDLGAASPAQPSDADLFTLNFIVCGDDANAPEMV
jgi:hypothetical protein